LSADLRSVYRKPSECKQESHEQNSLLKGFLSAFNYAWFKFVVAKFLPGKSFVLSIKFSVFDAHFDTHFILQLGLRILFAPVITRGRSNFSKILQNHCTLMMSLHCESSL